MAVEGKTWEKEGFKTRVENAMRNIQQAVQDQSVTMEKSWVMMMDQTDKEHEE